MYRAAMRSFALLRYVAFHRTDTGVLGRREEGRTAIYLVAFHWRTLARVTSVFALRENVLALRPYISRSYDRESIRFGDQILFGKMFFFFPVIPPFNIVEYNSVSKTNLDLSVYVLTCARYYVIYRTSLSYYLKYIGLNILEYKYITIFLVHYIVWLIYISHRGILFAVVFFILNSTIHSLIAALIIANYILQYISFVFYMRNSILFVNIAFII